MNVTLNDEGYSLDGTMRLVPVEITSEINAAIHSALMESLAATTFCQEYAEAIKAAPNPPQSLSPWQPIATAPKDGTEILMLRPSGKRIVVWWDANGWKSGDGVGHLALTPHAKWMHLPGATS